MGTVSTAFMAAVVKEALPLTDQYDKITSDAKVAVLERDIAQGPTG